MTSVRSRTWGHGNTGATGGQGREIRTERWKERSNDILHRTMLPIQEYIEGRLAGMGLESMFYSGLWRCPRPAGTRQGGGREEGHGKGVLKDSEVRRKIRIVKHVSSKFSERVDFLPHSVT